MFTGKMFTKLSCSFSINEASFGTCISKQTRHKGSATLIAPTFRRRIVFSNSWRCHTKSLAEQWSKRSQQHWPGSPLSICPDTWISGKTNRIFVLATAAVSFSAFASLARLPNLVFATVSICFGTSRSFCSRQLVAFWPELVGQLLLWLVAFRALVAFRVSGGLSALALGASGRALAGSLDPSGVAALGDASRGDGINLSRPADIAHDSGGACIE